MQLNQIIFTAACFFLCACSPVGQSQVTAVPSNDTSSKNTASEALEQLDILKDYDRDLWDGPDKWTSTQWRWKKALKWDRSCDYVADIDVYHVGKEYQLVQVMCAPGAYQPTYYLYLFTPSTGESLALELGARENTDSPKNVSGTLEFNGDTRELSITTLSRGLGDCGVYRVFTFSERFAPPQLIEKRQQACREEALPENPPADLFDPKKWPLENKTTSGYR